MDKIDKYIEELVNREIQEPDRYKKVVENTSTTLTIYII